LFNSHDRSKSFSISAGIWRFVCSNGLIIADSVFESYKIKYLGDRENDVAIAVAKITAIKPKESKLNKYADYSNVILFLVELFYEENSLSYAMIKIV